MSNKADVLDTIVGLSKVTIELKELIRRAAPTELPILLKGETGTGKTHIAKLIHELSGRGGPFISINLAAIPPQLASAELFGFIKGSFTGATNNRRGLIEAANGGTLFFDGLESAPPEIQVLLIRFLSEMSVTPVGSTKAIRVNVRVISSTISIDNRTNNIRRDLIDRLAGIVIDVPALRERKEDILVLCEYFLSEHKDLKLSDKATELILEHAFPGNIRELRHIIQRAAVLAQGQLIQPEDLGIIKYDIEEDQPSDSRGLKGELAAIKSELNNLKRTSIVADPIWEGRKFATEIDYCFVLMPFSDTKDIQVVYTNHIKTVVEKKCQLRCERADDIHDISGVMQSVWESINRARIIIAEMTDRNPNVFYELGIAHTLGKPVIMITQDMDYVPFDLKHLRCVVYQFKPGAINKFEDSLEKTIRRVLSSTYASPSTQIIQE